MNTLRQSINLAPLTAALAAILLSSSAIAFGCPGKQFSTSDSAPTRSTSINNQATSVRPGTPQDPSDQSRSIAAIVVALIAGGSTAFLAYKTWATRKSATATTPSHPHLEHPELELADLPKEALPQSSELVEVEREVALIR